MCASRASDGRGRGSANPAAVIPAGVSQHQAGPGPSRPVAAYPARRHRAVIAAQPGGLRAQGSGEQVVGGGVVLGEQDQAVDVPLSQPDHACIGAARGPGGDGVVKLSGHGLPA